MDVRLWYSICGAGVSGAVRPLVPVESPRYTVHVYIHCGKGSAMYPELTREELAAGLDSVVEEIFETAGVAGPPVDAMAVARTLGISVAWDDRQEGRARYVRVGGRRSGQCRATILLRPEPRLERRQWAVAHEIGEHVAHRVFARWGVDPPESVIAREHVANWLAGRLLLPTVWFMPDATTCGWDVLALKQRYATASHELIARRMLECPPAVIVSIFDEGRISFRRSNVPGRAPPPSKEEIECWSRVREHLRPSRTRQGPSLVQGWPIYEEGWKREILRTEVQQWDTDAEYSC
jgi:hypothetical protein